AAAAGSVIPVARLRQGIAPILCGALEVGDASFEDAIAVGDAGAPETLAQALAERALVAMARGQWDRAEVLAGQAGTVMRRAGQGGLLGWAAQAPGALPRGGAPGGRQGAPHAPPPPATAAHP